MKETEELKNFVTSTLIKAVIYCRVSSEKQEEDGTSLESQAEKCVAYARDHGYEVLEVVQETFTGTMYRERKKLTKIREMARRGEFDVLIFYAFDRLSRVQAHQIIIIEELEYYGIKVECVRENFENSLQGQLLRQTMGYMAQIDREKIIERTQNGRRKRAEKGRFLPGVKARYGYEWGGENKDFLTIKEEAAAVIQEIFTYFTTVKTSCNGVTRMLTEKNILSPSGRFAWNRAVVYDILTDPIYIGKAYAYRYKGHHMRPQEEWVPLPDGIAPAIIDEETFYKAQELLKINRIESMRNNPWEPDELLRAGQFLRCGYCGRYMVVNRYNRKKGENITDTVTVYACRNFYKNGSAPRCSKSPTIIAKRLDEAVWSFVGEIIENFTLVEEAVRRAKEQKFDTVDLKAIERSIKNARYEQEQYLEDLKQKNLDGTFKLRSQTTRGRLMAEIDKLEEHIVELEEEKQKILLGQFEIEKKQQEIDTFISWCLNSRETYAIASYEEKRTALRQLGIVVKVYRKDDPEHEQYEIGLTIPDLRDIVLPTSGKSIPCGFSPLCWLLSPRAEIKPGSTKIF